MLDLEHEIIRKGSSRSETLTAALSLKSTFDNFNVMILTLTTRTKQREILKQYYTI